MPIAWVELTKGCSCKIDARDLEWASQWKWFCAFSLKNKTPKGYAARSIRVEGKARLLWLHKEILTRHIGPAPEGQHIGDHVDGNSLNNCLSNLRWASFQMNARNKFGVASKQFELDFNVL